MRHLCTPDTDLDELVGHDEADGYHPGPLSLAMKAGEELELVASDCLSPVTQSKLATLVHGLYVVETGEAITPAPDFRLILH